MTTTTIHIGVLMYNLAVALNELEQRGAGPDHHITIECEYAYLRYEHDERKWIAVWYSEVDPE